MYIFNLTFVCMFIYGLFTQGSIQYLVKDLGIEKQGGSIVCP